jgi:hypothetical protein
MQAGEASVTLDNRDRRFDPSNTAGPYYPNVVPMRHLRIRATEGSTYDLFRGFVEDWGQQWSGPAPLGLGDAVCEVHVVDAFKVLNLVDVGSYQAAVLGDDPRHYFPLDEGLVVPELVNRGSYGSDGNLPNFESTGATVAAGPLYGGGTAITAGASGTFTAYQNSALDPAAKKEFLNLWTVEFWLYNDSTATPTQQLVRMTDANSNEFAHVGLSATADKLYVHLATGANVFTTNTIATNTWVHVAMVRTAMTNVDVYTNGVYLESITTPTPDGTGGALASILAVGQSASTRIAHVALYTYPLAAAQIATHYAANLGTLVPQSVDSAIAAVLDAIGWPAGLRSLGASTYMTQRYEPTGTALGTLLMLAENTDGGILFATGAGVLRFRSAADLMDDVSAAASWGDSSAELKYSGLTFAYDDADLYTEVRATAPGLTDAVASDAGATTTYGPRILETDGGILGDQNQLNDRASGYLLRYKAPALRPETLVAINSSTQPTRTTELFTSEIGRRLTVTRRPPGGGSAITITAITEGVSYQTVEQLAQIRGTLNLVPALDAIPWILADATYGVLGSTTDLGY